MSFLRGIQDMSRILLNDATFGAGTAAVDWATGVDSSQELRDARGRMGVVGDIAGTAATIPLGGAALKGLQLAFSPAARATARSLAPAAANMPVTVPLARQVLMAGPRLAARNPKSALAGIATVALPAYGWREDANMSAPGNAMLATSAGTSGGAEQGGAGEQPQLDPAARAAAGAAVVAPKGGRDKNGNLSIYTKEGMAYVDAVAKARGDRPAFAGALGDPAPTNGATPNASTPAKEMSNFERTVAGFGGAQGLSLNEYAMLAEAANQTREQRPAAAPRVTGRDIAGQKAMELAEQLYTLEQAAAARGSKLTPAEEKAFEALRRRQQAYQSIAGVNPVNAVLGQQMLPNAAPDLIDPTQVQ